MSQNSDSTDITMTENDEMKSKFFRKPPTKKTMRTTKPAEKAPETKSKKQSTEKAVFKKDMETNNSDTEKEKTTPTQERRILKEMLTEQSKNTVEAIDKMTSALIDKMSYMIENQTENPASRNLPNKTDINMEDDRQISIMEEIEEVEPWIQEQRLNRLKNHQKNVLEASRDLEDELDKIHNIDNHTKQQNKAIDKTRGNMIKMLTENITKMEQRIKILEEKDKTKDIVIQALTNKMNDQQQSKLSHKDNNTNMDTQWPAARKEIVERPIPTITQDQIDEQGYIKVENRRRKVIPITDISPGAGPAADKDIVPPISYANIHLQPKRHPPKEEFKMEVLDITKNSNMNDDEDDPIQLTNA